MPPKKTTKVAPTDDELNQLLEGIEDQAAPSSTPAKSQTEQQLLAELDELENLGAAPVVSRPHTPRVPTTGKRTGATPPPEAAGVVTRTSEDRTTRARKSGESTHERNVHAAPDVERPVSSEEAAVEDAGSGWWGGLVKTASAAMTTAQAAVKDIQSNEEALRWASQVKGNVGALRGLGQL